MDPLPDSFPSIPRLPSSDYVSPMDRRKRLLESDETKGELSIEDYLHRSEPFRTTTTTVPWPYPLTATAASPDIIAQVEVHRNEIVAILRDEGYPTDHHLFWLRVEDVSKPEYPMGNRPETMLRLTWMEAPYTPLRLEPAKDAIVQLMRQKGIEDVGVEIVFLDRCFRPSMFSIESTHPAVAVYGAVRRNVLNVVSRNLQSEWRMLSLFRLGLTRDESTSTPTIVVFVNPFTVRDWAALAVEIKLQLPPDDPVSMQIEVEFLPGFISELATAQPEPRPKPTHDGIPLPYSMTADGVPLPGTSITAMTERGGGSLGPFVTLTNGDRSWRCALTNHHVVRPPLGTSPSATNGTRYDVAWFAPKDAETTRWYLEANLTNAKKELEAAEEERAVLEACDQKVPARVSKTIDGCMETISDAERKLAVVRQMPIKLGETLASSGRTIADNKIADWALIELDAETLKGDSSNHVNKMPFIPTTLRSFDPTIPGSTSRPCEEGEVLTEFGTLREGSWYCKTGRTTHLTAGICNGVSTYCNWSTENRQRWSKDCSSRQLLVDEDGITEEWAITAGGVGPNPKRQDIFCDAGDSGAGIIDVKGRVCGLLYGGITSLCGRSQDQVSGLCSSMDDVRRWVEEKVPGATLSLPS
ncbi:hypothetical protein BJX61DRAFT_522498 [Aspergillus egyptiacus]|nr:hypothetical protein BJX61DRAFT_522498 [Aspergillus egyptiacus]